MSSIVRLSLVLFCVIAGPVAGAHITDKLVVGLYGDPSAEGTPIRLLSSGTPLDVLERSGDFARVRLADQTQGWVEATYVTEEKPAKAVLLETQARLRQMGLELAALREKQAPSATGLAPAAGEAVLRQSLVEAEARIADLEHQLAANLPEGAAQRRLIELEDSVEQALRLLADAQGYELRRPQAAGGVVGRYRSWIVGVIALLLGFGAGVALLDYRNRRRHGGFRV
jgi:SH3 domain protein